MSPEGGAAAPAADEPLDEEVLTELRAVGGDALVRELMAVFGERTPVRLASAERSLAAGDLEGAAAALHSLRSASGTVGARRLGELAGRLEGLARSGGAEALAAELDELRREVARVLAAAGRLA